VSVNRSKERKEGNLIKFKKLHEDAVIPQYQTPLASGFDFVTIEDVTLIPGETQLVRTGLACEIPEHCELQLRPRSGLSTKYPTYISNAPATIDADYRGEVKIIVTNFSRDYMRIEKGTRIAQGVVAEVCRLRIAEVLNLSETERGQGGFGSTGT